VALLASDREHREMVKALLPELWKKSANTEVLRLVAKLQPKDGPEFLLAGWNERTPAVRMQIIETLLSSDAWTLPLLAGPEGNVARAGQWSLFEVLEEKRVPVELAYGEDLNAAPQKTPRSH